MEFQVPQFIEQKPKIVGPFTLEQFFYILGAGAISFISYQLFSTTIWVFISLIVFALALLLVFVKVNGEPLSKIIVYFFKFMGENKAFTWQRKIVSETIEIDEETIMKTRQQMSLQEKLKSLSLKVSLGKIFSPPPKQPETQQKQEKYTVVSFITGEREIAKRVDYKE